MSSFSWHKASRYELLTLHLFSSAPPRLCARHSTLSRSTAVPDKLIVLDIRGKILSLFASHCNFSQLLRFNQ